MDDGVDSCAFANPFKDSCSTTVGRTLAFETDQSCLVRMYVLSDDDCSEASKLTIIDGVYKDIYDIVPVPGDTSIKFLARTVGKDMSLTFNSTTTTSQCSTGLSVPGPSPELNGCPVGTKIQIHSQVGVGRWGGKQRMLQARPNGGASSRSAPPPRPTAAPPPHPAAPQNTTNPYVPVFKYTSCEPCKAGTTCPTTSGVATSCPAGKYTPLLGALTCRDCGNGTVSNGGANACQECLPGTTPVPDKSTCDLCPGGTYSTLPGATCQACPAGTFRDADGGDGTECTKCQPGTFSSGPGASNCTECPAGTVATGEGSTSCTPWCAVGQAAGMPASRRDLLAACPFPCSPPILHAAHLLLTPPAPAPPLAALPAPTLRSTGAKSAMLVSPAPTTTRPARPLAQTVGPASTRCLPATTPTWAPPPAPPAPRAPTSPATPPTTSARGEHGLLWEQRRRVAVRLCLLVLPLPPAAVPC